MIVVQDKIWKFNHYEIFVFGDFETMLQNEYLIANIGVDTAENEPRKEWFVVASVVHSTSGDE